MDGLLVTPLGLPISFEEYISNYIVFLMRMITSCEIRRRSDFFEPFIMVTGCWWASFCQPCSRPWNASS